MSASLGPLWSLRSHASPRCLTAYAAGGNGDASSSAAAGGGGDASSNPFDDDDVHPSRPRQQRGRQHPPDDDGDDSDATVYAVAFGTERGSLHYRHYPPLSDAAEEGGGGGPRRAGYGREPPPRGRSGDPRHRVVDPESSPDGQIDLQGAVKGSIVGVVRAAPPAPPLGAGASPPATAPVFLLLVDDHRGTAASQSSSNTPGGAYAAHLVTVQRGAFHKLPAAPPADATATMMSPDHKPPLPSHNSHRRGGSHGGGGGTVGGGGWFGGEHGTPRGDAKPLGGTANAMPGGTSSTMPSLGTLPRMSCAAYHPAAGFVYAAGTGVSGLPTPAVRAVLAGLLAGITGPLHHPTNASLSTSRPRHPPGAVGTHPPPPTAVYPNCARALPHPGVRCSSSGGGSNGTSLALACRGRVAVVAVGHAFYAVPCSLDVNALQAHCSANGGEGHAPQQLQYDSAAVASLPGASATKLVAFAQSSQVHPVIAVEIMNTSSSPPHRHGSASDAMATQLRPVSSVLFLASGRECARVEIASIPNPRAARTIGKGGSVPGGLVSTSIQTSTTKQGVATLPSPILAAAPLPSTTDRGNGSNSGGDLSSGPLVALLTVDGLVHLRSPACVAVPLTSVEVGTRPNDYFALAALPPLSPRDHGRTVVATSHGGEARLLRIQPENPQDGADRLLRLCIDAFGSNGFPRLEVAEAVGATFAATSYVGAMEPTPGKRGMLRHYLESVLGLAEGGAREPSSSTGGGGGGGHANNTVSFVLSEEDGQVTGMEVEGGIGDDDGVRDEASTDASPSSSSLGANALLACTAVLCLVCYDLPTPNGAAACRAAKACASRMGTLRPGGRSSSAAAAVCELVADRLLKEVSTSFSQLTGNTSSASVHGRPSSPGSASMEFVESAVWLLRSCGGHAKAIDVLQERMHSPAFRNAAVGAAGSAASSLAWPQIKFDSYLATHLGELWGSHDDRCRRLVLSSPATKELIARNPTLGLSVFTTAHPQNEAEWKRMRAADDPLAHPVYPSKVVELLKAVTPQQHQESGGGGVGQHGLGTVDSFSPRSKATGPLPVDSGRALAVSYIESAIGIATGRPSEITSEAAPSFHADYSQRSETDELKADMHDELSYLLLEGVISERGDGESAEDTDLGALYRFKLRRLLSWPNSMIRSERLLGSLPSSFLREHALLLGRLGRHEDALKILYSQEQSLDLALEYCDVRHERQLAQTEETRSRGDRSGGDSAVKSLPPNECAYLPLVKVALTSDPDSERGTAAAIKVMALRRDRIDKAAALGLLPKDVPMSSLVRPFLLPAVVENESQVRRLTVASSLLRSKYIQLKQKLTEAQLKSQSTLRGALARKGLDLGDPLYSSTPTKARPVHAASPHYPDVTLVKHFFPRHLVIQAHVLNNATTPANHQSYNDGRTLADVAFVIAESSDEALVPTMGLPLKTIPPGAAGSVWCILAASPQRLDGSAFLTCELRFTVLEVDAATGTPLSFGDGANAGGAGFGRAFVEELQDMEVRHTEFG